MVSALEDYQAMDIKVGQKFWYTPFPPFPPSLPAIPPKNKFEIFLVKFVKSRFGSLQMWHASEGDAIYEIEVNDFLIELPKFSSVTSLQEPIYPKSTPKFTPKFLCFYSGF